jgi:hypothetical protein
MLRCVVFGIGALVLGIGVVDLFTRSRAVTYNVDEIANVDAIHNLLVSGDYTSARFGGVPFDPFISSGVLATWPHGVVLTRGGTLFAARVVSGLLVMTGAVLLILGFLRARGFAASTSLLVAAGVWLLQSVLPIHRDQLIMNSGEIWALLYLCTGLVVADRAPRLAAFLWGSSTWLCKFVYLPFAATFVVVGAAVEMRSSRERSLARFVRALLPRVGAFLLPLGLWMLAISLRHGPAAVTAWIERFLLVIRFHADSGAWSHSTPFLNSPMSLVVTTFLMLAAGPLALLAHGWLRSGDEHPAAAARWMLIGGSGVAVFSAVWFVAFDVTQNARHVLPAMYVSMTAAIYGIADIWKELQRRWPVVTSIVAALALVMVVWTCMALLEQRAVQSWRMSYAAACRAPALLSPPCQQDRALWLTYDAKSDLRTPMGACDADCFARFKQKIFDHARRVMVEGAAEGELYTAAYLMLLLQQNRLYEDEQAYARDVGAILCDSRSDVYRRYFAAAGLDVIDIVHGCERADVDPRPTQQILYPPQREDARSEAHGFLLFR